MKTILANGDSWTFGSEIAAEEFLVGPGEQGCGLFNRFKPGKACYDKENDYYRVPRTWASRLADRMNADAVIHAWPGRSNDTIYRSTIDWVCNEFDGDPRDLVVIIGWSGHERQNTYMEDLDGKVYEYTFWPSISDSSMYDTPMARQYFKFLVMHLWVQRETITRFIEHNFSLHNFLSVRGIEHYFFNSFYVPPRIGDYGVNGELNDPNKWTTLKVEEVLLSLRSQDVKGWSEPIHSHDDEVRRLFSMWNSIPDNIFIGKNSGETFKSYIESRMTHENAYIGMHPSPQAHDLWAQRLYDHIGAL